jgi:hypothetical protein
MCFKIRLSDQRFVIDERAAINVAKFEGRMLS